MKITFYCEAVTPIFMGGANKQPELRPPSIKGAMRWWCRALYGGHLYSSGITKTSDILQALHIKDSEIFGDTHRNAAFDIILKNYKNNSKYNLSGDYINYLGHGLSARKAINTEKTFDIIFNIRTQDENIIKYIIYSFWMLANLGNIGGRSRRGFGGFKVTKVTNIEIQGNNYEFINPNSLEDYMTGIKNVFKIFSINNGKNIKFPEFPEFPIIYNGYWNCYILDNSFNSFDEAMEFIGEKLRRFREDDKSPTSLKNKKGEVINHTFAYKTLKDSYEQFLKENNDKKGFKIDSQPEWSIFGLPHTIKVDEDEYSVTNCTIRGKSMENNKVKRERRASPLLIKIVKFVNNKTEYKIILQVFKSKFLDDGIVAKYKRTDINNKKRILASYTGFYNNGINFDKIDNFINSFTDKTDLNT